MTTTAKEADLAGPGIGSYEELAHVLPDDYRPLIDPLETMRALYDAAIIQRAKMTLQIARIRRELKRREGLDAKRVQE